MKVPPQSLPFIRCCDVISEPESDKNTIFPQFLELLLILKIIVQCQQALQKDVSVELSIFVILNRKVVKVVCDTSRSVKSYCGDELKEACGPPRGVTLKSLLTGLQRRLF